MRIGLFGGTFNPIHRCHLTIAHQTREQLHLDLVLFIPSGDPPHKPSESVASARHRVEMVRLAIASEPSFGLSDTEARRPTKSYSIETVAGFRREYGSEADLFFIIGLDAFLDLASWKAPSTLIQSCHFVVVSRPGATFARLQGMPLLPAIAPASLESLDRGPEGRLDLPLSDCTRLILLRLPPCEISASDIRSRLRHRQNISNLLPASVESYILREGLYREEANHPGI